MHASAAVRQRFDEGAMVRLLHSRRDAYDARIGDRTAADSMTLVENA
jgi:hypothetical protein